MLSPTFHTHKHTHVCNYTHTPVVSAVMTQISSVDPYRWAAWFTLAVTTLYIIITIVAFKETRSFRVPKCSSKAGKDEKGRGSGQRLGWKDIFVSWLKHTDCLPNQRHSPILLAGKTRAWGCCTANRCMMCI